MVWFSMNGLQASLSKLQFMSSSCHVICHRLVKLNNATYDCVLTISFWNLSCMSRCRSPVTSPHNGPLTRSFGIFVDLHLNKQLSKQSWGWWFETSSCSVSRHCNVWRSLGDEMSFSQRAHCWLAVLLRAILIIVLWFTCLFVDKQIKIRLKPIHERALRIRRPYVSSWRKPRPCWQNVSMFFCWKCINR